MTETMLIEQIKARSKKGAEQLDKEYRPRLERQLSAMGVESNQAEDVIQDTLMRVWDRIDTYAPEKTLGAWVRAIAKNLVFDRHRTATRRGVVALAVDVVVTDEGSEVVERAEFVRVLLAALNETQRKVVTMYHFEDRTMLEIARTLGIGRPAVRLILTDATKKMKLAAAK